MQNLTGELLSIVEIAILVTIYLVTTIICTATFFRAGYWIGDPLGGLFLQLVSSIVSAPLVEPRRIPETSRRLGVVFSFLFSLCGLVAEGAKLPHPESMSISDYGVLFPRAAVIGFIVMAAASGIVVVAGNVRRWVEVKSSKV